MATRIPVFASLLVAVTVWLAAAVGSGTLGPGTVPAPASGASPGLAHAAEPARDTVVVLVGTFQAGRKPGSGRVEILRLSNGRLVARLTSVRTDPGENLRVYLLGAEAVRNAQELERVGFIDLGPYEIGENRTYPIPANTPLSRIRAIAVWERDGNLNYTTATLTPP